MKSSFRSSKLSLRSIKSSRSNLHFLQMTNPPCRRTIESSEDPESPAGPSLCQILARGSGWNVVHHRLGISSVQYHGGIDGWFLGGMISFQSNNGIDGGYNGIFCQVTMRLYLLRSWPINVTWLSWPHWSWKTEEHNAEFTMALSRRKRCPCFCQHQSSLHLEDGFKSDSMDDSKADYFNDYSKMVTSVEI